MDEQEEEDGQEGGIELIRREDDFQGWLAQQKAGWRKRREERRLKKRSEARTQVRYVVCMFWEGRGFILLTLGVFFINLGCPVCFFPFKSLD